jgi:capsular exopolysaccharide synthesis family protein
MIRQTTETTPVRTGGPRHRLSGHYEALYRRLRFSSAQTPAPRTVGVTSAESGAGASTVAINLAIAAACGGCRTLLVDANLVSPTIARTLQVDPRPGLTDLLSGEVDLDECIYTTHIDRLAVLPAGPTVESSPLEVDWSRLKGMVRRAAADYELVVFDLPPTHELSAGLTVAALLDGVVLVLEADRTDSAVALRCKRQLVASGAKLLGVVLNKGG